MNIPKDETKTISISDALSFPEGTPIPRMVGRVALVWERKTGEGKWGPWTKQAGLLEDDNGNKIVFTVWNQPDLSDKKGKNMIFRAGAGKKPTMTLHNDFKDPTKRTLNVTATCHVLTEDEAADDIPMDYDKAVSHASQPMNNATQVNVERKQAIPEDGVNVVKHRLMQMANFRALCDAAVDYLYKDTLQDMNVEFKKDVSSCFFIQGMREGLEKHLPNNRPLSKPQDVEATEDLKNKEEVPF